MLLFINPTRTDSCNLREQEQLAIRLFDIIIVRMNKTSAREVELQNIIKSLQSKVHALKREGSLSKAELQQKIEEAVGRERNVVEEKEKTIAFLKDEVSKIRKQTEKQIKLATAHYEEEQRKSTTNLLKFQSQCELLENQLAKNREEFQKKMKEKQSQVNKLLYRCEGLQREKKQLLEQRQNFNKFYVSAIHKLPEREETLLWVDKLIEFMSRTQNILNNQSKQRDSSISMVTKSIRDELGQITHEFKKNEAHIMAEKQKFLEELQRLIAEAQRDYDEAIKSNAQFWDGYWKVKAKDETEQASKLENQLITCKQSHRKELQAFQQELRAVEKDKKNLLLNCQEMKNLYEIRDKTNKEEIELLKQSISELLQSQQLRQKQFEAEIQRLGEKIEHVTLKFYEKLDLPIQQMGLKLKQQIECFKGQFEGFYSDSLLQKQLQNFENHIVEYLVGLNNTKEERGFLRQTAEGALKIIDMIKEAEDSPRQPQTQSERQKMAYSTVSYTYQSNEKESKDKENKLNYELAIAKKQLQKMRQHCKTLEGRSKGKQAVPSRIIELTAQNEQLRERVTAMEQGVGGVSEGKVAEARLARLNGALLQKLRENSELMIRFAEKEEEFIDRMGKCIGSLNTFIINPVQMFERLTFEIDRMRMHPPKDLPTVRQTAEGTNSFEAKKDAFALLLSKKNENAVYLQRATNELSKHLRQSLGKCGAGRANRPSAEEEKAQVLKSSQSKILLERRMKQVQTQKIKNREQMLARLRILDDKFKTLEQKYTKRQTISFNKVEEGIAKRIHDVLSAFNSKEKLKDLGKITEQAFNDLQSKLKECLVQNQGLVKESELLRNYRP